MALALSLADGVSAFVPVANTHLKRASAEEREREKKLEFNQAPKSAAGGTTPRDSLIPRLGAASNAARFDTIGISSLVDEDFIRHQSEDL